MRYENVVSMVLILTYVPACEYFSFTKKFKNYYINEKGNLIILFYHKYQIKLQK